MDSQRWDESSEIYAETAPLISLYRCTCNKILDNVKLDDGASIIDLGCGSSCLLISKILNKFQNIKSIYAIDASNAMIMMARNRIRNEKVNFIVGSAENIDKIMKDKVDAIFCNSAFWLFDQVATLRASKAVLQENGIFKCNYPEWDVDLGGTSDLPKRSALNKLLGELGLPPRYGRSIEEKLSVEDIVKIFGSAGFKILSMDFFSVAVTADDWRNFYKIPAILHRAHPSLPVDLAMKIYQDAHGSLSQDDCLPVKWMTVSARVATS